MVEYHSGHLNSVADALSRRDADTAIKSVELPPLFCLLNDICAATATDTEADHLLQQLRDTSLEALWSSTMGSFFMASAYLCPHSRTYASRWSP